MYYFQYILYFLISSFPKVEICPLLSYKTPEEVLGEELGKIVASGYRKALEAGEPIDYEDTLPFPAGIRTWQVRITPVLVNGRVRYLVGARKMSERPYRKPLTKDIALREIKKNSGSQFDPRVVEHFLALHLD
ncbi:PAS domain-containing protein [Thermovorax subterraneus]|nr:PAS domain-containing protein [Thermovorax subterraneus]